MDVAAWLRSLGLGKYEKAFLENDIDAKVLGDITGEDLIELGVASIGHCRTLLSAAAHLRDQIPAVPDQGAAVDSVLPLTSHLPNPERR